MRLSRPGIDEVQIEPLEITAVAGCQAEAVSKRYPSDLKIRGLPRDLMQRRPSGPRAFEDRSQLNGSFAGWMFILPMRRSRV
jgi:hypothetical protein